MKEYIKHSQLHATDARTKITVLSILHTKVIATGPTLRFSDLLVFNYLHKNYLLNRKCLHYLLTDKGVGVKHYSHNIQV